MAQLGLDGMPQPLFSCTPTRLNTWLDCPRRYRFTYLDRPTPPKGPPWAHSSFGVSLHQALRDWWDLAAPDRTPEAAARLVAARWRDEGFRDAEQSDRWRDLGGQLVLRYVESLDAWQEPLGLERTVAMRTDRLAFSGRVDRIDRATDESGEAAVVVDYKTGRHAPDEDDARSSLALALYASAVERTLRLPCHRVELHHLPTGRVVGWAHTERTLQRHLRRATSIGVEAQTAETVARQGEADRDALFPTQPGPLCGWCDFRVSCPEGQQAGPARQPWDGLAEPAEPSS